MPSVQNRSRFVVTVKNRNDLTKFFSYNCLADVKSYVATLRTQNLKPRIDRTDDAFEVRIRTKGFPPQNMTFTSEADAKSFINTVTEERKRGVFIDYTGGWQITFADLVARYIREEAPKHKGFEMEAYKLNALLEDAGRPRVDLKEVVKDFPRLANTKIRTATGARMREASANVEWVNKPFATLEPGDFEDYIKERLEVVAPSTVDREVDLLSSICRVAIDTWRIHVVKSPMDGVRRPRYLNERDRRLRPGEEARLMEAARAEDRERSIAERLEELVADAKLEARARTTTYARKALIKDARETYRGDAERTYTHVPLLETFLQFQLMTAARRSETLNLTWDYIDVEEKTAYLPETKNGRPRKLPLRDELLEMLAALPRTGTKVFGLTNDGLRKAWRRICEAAGSDDLHLHDLRHEGVSRVAETGQFSLVDLQAFSGHRDVRMLLRYTHLCARQLADRLNIAFDKGQAHRGRKRIETRNELSVSALIKATTTSSQTKLPSAFTVAQSAEPAPVPRGAQVIPFPGRRVA